MEGLEQRVHMIRFNLQKITLAIGWKVDYRHNSSEGLKKCKLVADRWSQGQGARHRECCQQ